MSLPRPSPTPTLNRSVRSAGTRGLRGGTTRLEAGLLGPELRAGLRAGAELRGPPAGGGAAGSRGAGLRVEGGRGPGAVSGSAGNGRRGRRGRRAHLAVVQRERHQVRRGCAAAHGHPLDALHGGARARTPALRMPSARGAGRCRARGGPGVAPARVRAGGTADSGAPGARGLGAGQEASPAARCSRPSVRPAGRARLEV